MGILKDVLAELFSMFVTDARLTLTTLFIVALVAMLMMVLHVNALVCGLEHHIFSLNRFRIRKSVEA